MTWHEEDDTRADGTSRRCGAADSDRAWCRSRASAEDVADSALDERADALRHVGLFHLEWHCDLLQLPGVGYGRPWSWHRSFLFGSVRSALSALHCRGFGCFCP